VIERQQELRRRHHRKLKMRKLKAKLSTATGEARTVVLAKIKKLSPTWTEASLQPAPAAATEKAPKEPKKKASKPKA
jgi:indole-3-glycerol phosphate synthase